jgi:hypothetical protein
MSQPSRCRRGLVAALVVGAAVALAGPAAAKETVALNFGWPSDLRGQVTFSARTTQTVNGRSEAISMSGRYDFMTSGAADGLLIRFDNVETQVENSAAGPQAMVKKYLAKAASAPPSYVVAGNGQFVRIEGLEEFRGTVLGGVDDAFAEFPADVRQQVVQVIGRILTKEQLEASIVSEWNMYVGAWIDAELDQGDVYEITYQEPVPALGNMAVPMRAQFMFRERAACDERDEARRCVELELRTFVDPEGMSAALQALLRQLPEGQNAARVEDMQQEMVVRLITEPGTLLPHLLESSKRTVSTVSLGEEQRVSSQVEEKRFVYTY